MSSFTVLASGPLTLLQDLGRVQFVRQGVAVSGAADRGAHALAQRLCGNDDTDASLEVLLGGLTLRANDTCVVAVTGANGTLTVDGAIVGHNAALMMSAGSVLALGRPLAGLRSYLAVRGGFDVPVVLASRSRDTLGGIGPLPVQSGDLLPIGQPSHRQPWFEVVPVRAPIGDMSLAISPGPHDDALDEHGWHLLSATTWTVDPSSNRIGYRLNGPPLSSPASDIASFPVIPGCVQLAGNGQPIILGPDAGVTGGYPVIGVIDQRGLDLLAQARPGDQLRIHRACFGLPDSIAQYLF